MPLHLIINTLILKQMEPSGVHRFDASGLSNPNSVKTDRSCKYFTALKIKLYPDGQQVGNSSQFFT